MRDEEFVEDDLESDAAIAAAESESDDDEPQSKPDEETEEPWEFNACTITATIALLPDDGDEQGRPMIIGVRSSHLGATPKMRMVRASQMGELPAPLAQLLAELEQEFPELAEAYKLKTLAEKQVEEERQQRLALSRQSTTKLVQSASQPPKAGIKPKAVKVNKNAPISSATVQQSVILF